VNQVLEVLFRHLNVDPAHAFTNFACRSAQGMQTASLNCSPLSYLYQRNSKWLVDRPHIPQTIIYLPPYRFTLGVSQYKRVHSLQMPRLFFGLRIFTRLAASFVLPSRINASIFAL
jgi:hypothetical protein